MPDGAAEQIKVEVIIYDGAPALRLTCTRGEARKRTRGQHIEIIKMDPKAASTIGRALLRTGEGLDIADEVIGASEAEEAEEEEEEEEKEKEKEKEKETAEPPARTDAAQATQGTNDASSN